MFDPLAEVVTLLQPSASLSKIVSGAGAWRVQRSVHGQPFYCAILQGDLGFRRPDIRRSPCRRATSC